MSGAFPFLPAGPGGGEQHQQGMPFTGPEYLSFAGFHPGAIQGMAGGHPHIHQPQMQQMLAGAVPNWPLAGFAVPSNVQAAAARARASQRQQAKRASRQKGRPVSATQDDGESGDESDSDEDGNDDDDNGDAQVPTGDVKRKSRGHGSGDNDKEHKRLKRLLRNRVSAQQARERKKTYVQNIETRTKEYEEKCAVLEQRVSTLERENFVLRQVLKSTALQNGAGGFQADVQHAPQNPQVSQDAAVPDMSQEQM